MSAATSLAAAPPVKVRLFANPSRPASAAAGGGRQAPGFYPDAGTDFTTGDEAKIAGKLDELAKSLGVAIFGISGARTPAHSVAVGGSANDPHTQAKAADIGVNSKLRSSASVLTDAQLASVGLYRPFGGATEINHVQLKDGGGGVLDKAKDAAGGVLDAGKGVIKGAETAGELAGAVAGFLSDPRRALLYLLLLAGGAALAVTGLVYTLGTTPGSVARRAGGAAAKGALIA